MIGKRNKMSWHGVLLMAAALAVCLPVFAADNEQAQLIAPCGSVNVPPEANLVCVTFCGPLNAAAQCGNANHDLETVDPKFALSKNSDLQILVQGSVNIGQFCNVMTALTGWKVTSPLDASIRIKPGLWSGGWNEFVHGPELETTFAGCPVILSVNQDKNEITVLWSGAS